VCAFVVGTFDWLVERFPSAAKADCFWLLQCSAEALLHPQLIGTAEAVICGASGKIKGVGQECPTHTSKGNQRRRTGMSDPYEQIDPRGRADAGHPQ
jgi:hypothetical protein